jgi:transposase
VKINCQQCEAKQAKLDAAEVQIATLEKALAATKEKVNKGPFGSSTPSSKIPFKEKSLEEKQLKKGGSIKGHKGHGRQKITPDNSDDVKEIEPEINNCESCGSGEFIEAKTETRGVVDAPPPQQRKICYRLKHKKCVACGTVKRAKLKGVMPKAMYSNQLITNFLDLHYMQNMPMGRVQSLLGIPYAAMINIAHRVAKLLEPVKKSLIEEYKLAPVKHADETSWRTDGANGYIWLFATKNICIFEFKNTRAASVVKGIFGETALQGVLVVDRYNGYNRVPCLIQYCYAHLLRKIEDLEEEFSDDIEVGIFSRAVAHQLSEAMKLAKKHFGRSDKEYYTEAKSIQAAIFAIMAKPAKHFGVIEFQNLFITKKHRLYHWVTDRRVPPDNNLSERFIRSSVTARKVSFGSQSTKGAETRGLIMTALKTLALRRPLDYQNHFKKVLDEYSLDQSIDIFDALFAPNSLP